MKGRWLLIASGAVMLLLLAGLVTCTARWEQVGRESEARIAKQRAVFDGPGDGPVGGTSP